MTTHPGTSASGIAPRPETSSRLLQATTELRYLNKAMMVPRPEEVDPRVLHDFREAMDHVRLTSWAAQQWLLQYRLDGNPETALSILTAERVRRTTQLATELASDLVREAADARVDTARLERLYEAVERLYLQLHRQLNKSAAAS